MADAKPQPGSLSIPQFAAKVRSAYPDVSKGMTDAQLVKEYLSEKPEDQNYLSTEALEGVARKDITPTGAYGKSLLLKEAAPLAAGAAGLAAGGPLGAMAAYGGAEGVVNPEQVLAHPVREGIYTALWGVPGPLEVASKAAPRIAAENPLAIKLGGAALGAVGGGMLGEKYGGRYGEAGGVGVGALAGWRAGVGAVSDAGQHLIQQALEGSYPAEKLPSQLLGKFEDQQINAANLAVKKAIATGSDLDLSKTPEAAKDLAKMMYQRQSEKEALASQKEMIRVGGEQADWETKNLINDVIERKKPLSQLTSEMFPRYMKELTARANAYLELAAQQGADIQKIQVPTSVKEMAEQMAEERVKQFAKLPPLVATPEQVAAEEQAGRAYKAIGGVLKPKAQAAGMAQAAGEQEGRWVPSTRSVKTGTTRGSKIFPRIP